MSTEQTLAPATGSEPLANLRHERFVELYLQGGEESATQAYIDAGYRARGNSAEVNACRLLRDAQVAARLAYRRAQVVAEVQAETGITREKILRYWWDQATADARDLVELRQDACRYCHGTDHQYQRTTVELERALAEHAKREERLKEGETLPEFDMKGGTGYNPNRAPHPECPECFGRGVPAVVAKDTRQLSPQAALVYDGVKQGKDGQLEIKVRDRDAAVVNAAKHLGMFVEKHEVGGLGGGPLVVSVVYDG